MAMFAALAVGAPLGTTLYGFGGFISIAGATVLIPLATLLLVAPMAAIPPHRGKRAKLLKMVRIVWMPGLGSALELHWFRHDDRLQLPLFGRTQLESGLASL